MGGGLRLVVITAAFHARVWDSVPDHGGLKETKMFLRHPRVKVSIVGSLRDREVACSTARVRFSNPVSGGQCHLNHLTILRRFSWPSLACMDPIKPDSFHFISLLYVMPFIFTLTFRLLNYQVVSFSLVFAVISSNFVRFASSLREFGDYKH